MDARNVWMGNQSWPNNKSCGQFAKDVFRLAGAKTDKQKALAFYDWIQRCMMRGANLHMPDGAGGYSRTYDPLVLLTSWGFGECTFWGWVATECLCAAGVKARRVVVHKQGHTYYEVWYKGDDGVEQWHAFDPYIGWYFLNENGEVASCEQLARNPRLVQNPLPGHPVPLGSHPERSGLGHRHRTEDLVIIDQPILDEQNQWDLKPGMEVTYNFLPEVPSKALFTHHPAGGDERPVDNRPDGTHDDINEISRLGFRQYASHIPYWKNYMWPTPNKNLRNEGQPVRWHGAGALRWCPLLQGAAAPVDARYAVFENGCLRPTGSHHFCDVTYHIQVPHLISWLDVDYDVAGSGGDIFGLQVSTDRKTWWPLKTPTNGPGWGSVLNGQAEWKKGEPSVQGLKEFYLQVNLLSHAANPTLALQALRIAVGFQHNMHVQPRLVPGANTLWLEAAELAAGQKLQAEWIYQVDGEEKRACVGLSRAGRAEEKVTVDVDCPSRILMTGVRLCCV